MNLLESLVIYLAPKINMVAGTNAYYNNMPSSPDLCLNINEPKFSTPVHSQINAEVHFIKFSVRATSNDEAYNKASQAYRWLLSDQEDIENNYDSVDTPGIINLNSNLIVRVELHGKPILEDIDQQGRKTYFFTATITTPRIF